MSSGKFPSYVMGKVHYVISGINFLETTSLYENIACNTVKALLSPGGAYLFFAVLEGAQ